MPSATAEQGRRIRRGEDWFGSGSSVSLPAKIVGDALATAGHLQAHGEVGEDLIAAADRITVSGPIDGSAYLAAGCMRLDGEVHHNVRGIGWELIVARAAHIDGGATLAGNEVQFDGTAGPYLMIVADHAIIDGHVAGDVLVTARSIDVGPHAQIDGALHFGALQPVRIAAGATISGGVHVLPNASGADAELLGATLRAGWWVWLLGWLLVAAVVLGLWPRFTVSVSTAVRRRSLYCLLLGLAVLIGTPLLAALLLVTVLGVPLSLLIMLLYLVLIPFGYLSAATSTGDWLLLGVRALRIPAASGAWRLSALTLVLIALHLLMRVPILGIALNLLMLVVGSGGLLLALSVHRRAPPGALEMATTAIDF